MQTQDRNTAVRDEIKEIAQRIIAEKLHEAPASGVYTPTLVIGLGGTGVLVVRALAGFLAAHKTRHVRLLAIDSDSAENGRHISQFSPLEPGRELLILEQAPALRMLANAVAGTSNAHVLEALPKETKKHGNIHEVVVSKINRQSGAGQFRKAGALLWNANVSGGANLDGVFAAVRNELIGLDTVIAHEARGVTVAAGVRIFLVASFVGGQGSGALPSCLALTRKHFNGDHDTVTLIGVLPGPLFEKRVLSPAQEGPVMAGNGLGTMREVQGAKLGFFRDREFVFDDSARFTPKLLPLVNDILLVDHRSHGQRPFRDLPDLCRGVGLFLYSFVASGVGAHSESSRINGRADMRLTGDGLPHIFSSIGVGAAIYPASDLIEFGIRDSLSRWLFSWLEAAGDVRQAKEEVAAVLARWQLGSLDTLRARLQPKVAEAVYLVDRAQKDAVLKLPDPDFLGKGEERLDQFPKDLAAYEGQFSENQQRILAELTTAVREQTLIWLAAGAKHGALPLTVLREAIGGLKGELGPDQDARLSTREALKEQKRLRTAQINFWGVGLDRPFRKRYIKVVNDLLASALNERTDAAASAVLSGLENALTSLETEANHFCDVLAAFRDRNANALSEMANDDTSSCFVLPVIAPAEYPAWAAENGTGVPSGLQPKSLAPEEFILQAVNAVADYYVGRTSQYDLAAEALKDENLMRRVKTIQTSADFMINLDLVAPPIGQLQPQKFLAGYMKGGNSAIIRQFDPPDGGAQIVPVETTNKHAIIIAQTVHGFPFAHWAGFQEAENCYRLDPWWAHTISDYGSLPLLKPVSGDRAKALRTFGLGLAFELIYPRGANYYKNVKDEEINSCKTRWFVYYRNTLNPGGTALVEAQLVSPALSSQTRVRPEHLIGKSLAETLQALANPSNGAFITLVDEVLDELCAKIGVDQFRTVITEFVQKQLDKMIESAVETRRDLEETARELRAYIQQLG